MGERIRAPRAADILGVTVRTVQNLAQRGTIPALRRQMIKRLPTTVENTRGRRVRWN